MAREILFRGKTRDEKEWIEGFYAVFSNTPFIGAPNRYGTMLWQSVISKTVGQFTGLTDKNGKRIFEGDILHIVSYTCDYDFKTSVGAKYGYTSGLYVDGDFDGGDFNEIGFAFDYWSNEDAEVEVIGNIHDNPELLNGTES